MDDIGLKNEGAVRALEGYGGKTVDEFGAGALNCSRVGNGTEAPNIDDSDRDRNECAGIGLGPSKTRFSWRELNGDKAIEV